MADIFYTKIQGIMDTYKDIITKLSDPAIINNQNQFKELSKRKSGMEKLVFAIEKYMKTKKELDEANQILHEEKDPDLLDMAKEEISQKSALSDEMEQEIKFLMLPKDPNEGKNVIVEIRAGTGGDEAALFAADLYRMYYRYAEIRGWKTEIISANETGIGGYKEIIFYIKGQDAYNYLKFEAGVHRVQRVPETESQGRVHTSAVTVAVLPEVEEAEVNIDPKDIKIDVYRASGAGGQHVNKTESAVRITHIPTGIVVTCQDEKSQIKNKARAMKVLYARVYEMEEEKKNAELSAERKEMIKTGDRSEKIRTYNFPQSRVTDHRVNVTLYNLQQFLDGDMQQVIDALIVDQKEKLMKNSQF